MSIFIIKYGEEYRCEAHKHIHVVMTNKVKWLLHSTKPNKFTIHLLHNLK